MHQNGPQSAAVVYRGASYRWSTMELAAHAVIPRRASGAFGRLDIACTASKPRTPPAVTVKKSATGHRCYARRATLVTAATYLPG